MRTMSSLTAITIALTLAALTGCGGGDSPTVAESATVDIRAVLAPVSAPAQTSPASVAQIHRVVVYVSNADFDEISHDLDWNPDTYTATGSVNVPIGNERRFMVEAIRADGLVLYRGETAADVVGNIRVAITLTPPDVEIDLICPIHEFDGPARITIESVPDYGQSGYAEGSVANVVPWECAVAVYIKVGGSWWTKPYWNNPLTTIDTEGRWLCNIVTGGLDRNAVEIRAYLVRAGYTPPIAPTEGLPPDPPTPDVLAMDAVTRTPPQE